MIVLALSQSIFARTRDLVFMFLSQKHGEKKLRCSFTFSDVLSDSERFPGVQRHGPVDRFWGAHDHLLRRFYPGWFWRAFHNRLVVDPRACRGGRDRRLRLRLRRWRRRDARLPSGHVPVYLRLCRHCNVSPTLLTTWYVSSATCFRCPSSGGIALDASNCHRRFCHRFYH